MQAKELLRGLPAVDEVLQADEIQAAMAKSGRSIIVNCIREAIGEIRKQILAGQPVGHDGLKAQVIARTLFIARQKEKYNLRPVLNATGIILHTNLGRAVLSAKAKEAINRVAGSYNNLELDLATGERGSRYSHVVDLLKVLTGCEDALVVNNNAAAVLLTLGTLAKGKEVIVSRGQLVEIGGSFRVPEVMAASGAQLVEVGTTNKTYLKDYASAITENTAVLLKVHTSNYRVIGFTHETSTAELVALGKERGIPVVEDLGSGFLVNLESYGITGEPNVQELVRQGVDVVTFSGDKLLGGPQAGIIVGRKEYVSLMKKNPLTRALRVDKLTMSALEATLREYLDSDRVLQDNPTLRMLTTPAEQLKKEAEKMKKLLQKELPGVEVAVEQGYSQAGGGSLPTTDIPTYLVTLHSEAISEDKVAEKLRQGEPAVLVRIAQGKIILDVRTILPGEEELLVEACSQAFKSVQEG
ncbi:L-seryl-tRNA(Sec) selenium transferase [Zhaonella formicivorans]|uniref:L-seryl-tRNA(Sec) selenium transferase n=1 Tax=Zhaonella formicivorans TaxID=2528593 RepID=UPI001D10228C|nr:L-seryl-tRNA(Sec) selenium transferase [Zhaonella formicivorans]